MCGYICISKHMYRSMISSSVSGCLSIYHSPSQQWLLPSLPCGRLRADGPSCLHGNQGLHPRRWCLEVMLALTQALAPSEAEGEGSRACGRKGWMTIWIWERRAAGSAQELWPGRWTSWHLWGRENWSVRHMQEGKEEEERQEEEVEGQEGEEETEAQSGSWTVSYLSCSWSIPQQSSLSEKAYLVMSAHASWGSSPLSRALRLWASQAWVWNYVRIALQHVFVVCVYFLP